MKNRFILIALIVTWLAALPINSSAGELVGPLVRDINHIDEVAPFSNTVVIAPENFTFNDVRDYLNKINNRMDVVIASIGFFTVKTSNDTFLVRNIFSALTLASKVQQSVHSRRVVFHFDEPLWQLREACAQNHRTACDQIENNGEDPIEAIEILNGIIADLRQALPGSEVSVVESWAEASIQQNSTNALHMPWDADHLGYNCYGPLASCGSAPYGPINFVQLNIDLFNSIKANKSSAKVILVPAIGFSPAQGISNETSMLNILNVYKTQFEAFRGSSMSGFIGFIWSELSGWTAGRELSPTAKQTVINTFNNLK